MSTLKRASRAITLVAVGFSLALSCITHASRNDIPELRAKIENHKGSESYGDMVIAALELQELAHSQSDLGAEIYAFKSLGVAYGWLGFYEDALRAYESAVDLSDTSVEPEIRIALYDSISQLLNAMGRTEEALELIAFGIKIAKDAGDPEMLAILNVKKGAAMLLEGNVDVAEELFRSSAFELRTGSNERDYGAAINNLGMVYKIRGEYDAALEKFQTVLVHAKRADDRLLTGYALLELGDINRKLERYQAARDFLDQALSLSKEAGDTNWRHYAHNYMATLDQETGNMEAAAKHRAEASRLEKQMLNDEILNRAKLLKSSVAVMEHKNRIVLLEKDKKIQSIELERSRTLALVIGLGLLLLAIALWVVYKQYRAQARTSLQLSEANTKLDDLATTDVLTGLRNRRYIMNLIENDKPDRRASAQDTTLILIDLDFFKRINDQYGHDHGDAVLMEVSRRLQSELRDTDKVARWGGEEFLVLLPHTEIEQGMGVADALRKALAGAPIEFGGLQQQITATLGVASYAGTTSFNESLRRADQALYRGKTAGRNRVEIAA